MAGPGSVSSDNWCASHPHSALGNVTGSVLPPPLLWLCAILMLYSHENIECIRSNIKTLTFLWYPWNADIWAKLKTAFSSQLVLLTCLENSRSQMTILMSSRQALPVERHFLLMLSRAKTQRSLLWLQNFIEHLLCAGWSSNSKFMKAFTFQSLKVCRKSRAWWLTHLSEGLEGRHEEIVGNLKPGLQCDTLSQNKAKTSPGWISQLWKPLLGRSEGLFW